MTLEECLRLPAVVLAENFLFLCCPACLSGPWMERPALKARDKAWLGRGTKLHPVQPFLLDALHLHQLPPPLPPSTLLQLCQMAAAALNSCWTHKLSRQLPRSLQLPAEKSWMQRAGHAGTGSPPKVRLPLLSASQ